jgi:hypothetical protein
MNTDRVSWWGAIFRALLTLVVMVIVGACSGDGSEAKGAQDDDPSFAKTQYEIRFFAGTGADTKALSVGPDPALWLTGVRDHRPLAPRKRLSHSAPSGTATESQRSNRPQVTRARHKSVFERLFPSKSDAPIHRAPAR